jgi:hypothetical protein
MIVEYRIVSCRQLRAEISGICLFNGPPYSFNAKHFN